MPRAPGIGIRSVPNFADIPSSHAWKASAVPGVASPASSIPEMTALHQLRHPVPSGVNLKIGRAHV